jgi:hypothetical protein
LQESSSYELLHEKISSCEKFTRRFLLVNFLMIRRYPIQLTAICVLSPFNSLLKDSKGNVAPCVLYGKTHMRSILLMNSFKRNLLKNSIKKKSSHAHIHKKIPSCELIYEEIHAREHFMRKNFTKACQPPLGFVTPAGKEYTCAGPSAP